MINRKTRQRLKKVWHFIWEDNSIWSWIVNIILAFILIKFIVYPFLSLVLSTSHPIVAVVSSSMEHHNGFDEWWKKNNKWYITRNITKEQFERFPMKNGFNRGDIIILLGKQPKDIKTGDIIVFNSNNRDPIIHRVVGIKTDNQSYIYSTKGDNNRAQIIEFYLDETNIPQSDVIGRAFIRIPLLGYVKILSVEIVCNLYPFNFCRK